VKDLSGDITRVFGSKEKIRRSYFFGLSGSGQRNITSEFSNLIFRKG
jgi:hypothetical protein